MIADPPSLVGTVKLIVADPPEVVAEVMVGADGAAAGVTLPDGIEGAEGPTALTATTVNVSATPFGKP